MKLNRNEVMLLRGILHTKRMYKGMKNLPHGVVVYEDWMEEKLLGKREYIKYILLWMLFMRVTTYRQIQWNLL